MVMTDSVVDFFRSVFGLRSVGARPGAAHPSVAHLNEIAQLGTEAALARLSQPAFPGTPAS